MLTLLKFSLTEAAEFLRMDLRTLRRLLRLTGLSATYDACGHIGEGTLRILYTKLHH